MLNTESGKNIADRVRQMGNTLNVETIRVVQWFKEKWLTQEVTLTHTSTQSFWCNLAQTTAYGYNVIVLRLKITAINFFQKEMHHSSEDIAYQR